MIGLENKDSSFFTIESPNIRLSEKDFNKNLISLTIDERMGGMPTGTLSFYDSDHYFSRILRTGVKLIISWGYKKFNETPDSLITKTLNYDEISGQIIRKGWQGFVSSPTGEGGEDGVVKYNCNFTAFGFRGEENSKIYTSGTKKTVVSQAFDDIGVSPIFRLIDFSLGNDKITSDHYVRKEESTFAFLTRLSIEWSAIFNLAFSPNGDPVGIFVDPNKANSTNLPSWVLACGGTSNAIGYKGELNNVRSYKWSNSESESGVGDNVIPDIVDGQIIFRRYTAQEEKIITWRLDQKKIQSVYNKAGDLNTQLKLTQELLSKKNFESVKHFFIPVESTTAPNGYGYRIDCEMIGNPLYIPGNRIVIKNGFPDRLGGTQSKWYIYQVNHKIDRSGYNMSVNIVDTFNLSPIGMPVL